MNKIEQENICKYHADKINKATKDGKEYEDLDEDVQRIVDKMVEIKLSYMEPYILDINNCIAALSNNQSIRISFAVKNNERIEETDHKIWLHFAEDLATFANYENE